MKETVAIINKYLLWSGELAKTPSSVLNGQLQAILLKEGELLPSFPAYAILLQKKRGLNPVIFAGISPRFKAEYKNWKKSQLRAWKKKGKHGKPPRGDPWWTTKEAT